MAGGGLPWDFSWATLSLPTGQCRGTWMGVSPREETPPKHCFIPLHAGTLSRWWVRAAHPACQGRSRWTITAGLAGAVPGGRWPVPPPSRPPAASALFPPPPSAHPRPATVDTCPRVSWLPTCSLWLSFAGRSGVSGTVPSFPTPASVSPPLPWDLAEGWGHQEGAGSRVTPAGEGPERTRTGSSTSSSHLRPRPDASRHN